MKKLKFILSVLLSFLIVFSVFPSTVYAGDDDKIYIAPQTFVISSVYNNEYKHTLSKKDALLFSTEPILCKNLQRILYTSSFNVTANKGDKFSFSFYINSTNFSNYTFSVVLDNTSLFDDKIDFVLTPDNTKVTYNLTFNQNVSNVKLTLVGTFTPINETSEEFGIFGCNGYYSVTDEKSGLLKSILEWLQNIRDKIVNLPSEFGSFITDLKNNVSSWFNDLKANISQWFSDVGDWFTDLGDNIGSFFTDLWDNITIKFEEINTDITNWWQSVKDWFHSLFVPEDGWIEDYKKRIDSFLATHLGMLYEAPRLISSIFTLILGAFKKPANGSVVIPRITFPGTSYVLIDYTEFNLNTIINSNERFKWMYDTFKIASSAILFLLVLNYCRKELDEFLKDREVSE